MSSVSAILQQMAENAGRAQLARGQTYGSLVAQASQVPAQIMDDRERQATLDFQRAREAQQMALATRADQRATLDQAYQDQTRAQELEKQQKVRAILGAYTAGTPNDPSTNNLAAGIAKAREVGLPEWIPNLWELHKKEQEFTNPRPYETDPTKDQRSSLTNEIITPARPKMPEIGTPGYGIATRIQDIEGTGAPSAPPTAAGSPPPGPASTYAGRADLLQNGPPPSTVPAGGPGAPATTAALSPITPTGPAGPAASSLPPPAGASGVPPARPTHAQAVAQAYAEAEAAKDPVVQAYGKRAGGQPLTPAETALIAGYEAKAGVNDAPVTVKTMVNGKAVEKVMTRKEALAAGVFASQPPASVQIQNMPPAPVIPASKAEIAMANYMIPTPSPRSFQTREGKAMLDRILTVNPDFDASLYSVRAPTRKAYTTGPQGQQLTAMNTAIEHLDQLQAAADALQNGTFKPGNAAYNALADLFGSGAPTSFATIKEKVDKELDAVASKGVPTVSGAAAQKAIGGVSSSPESIKNYIDTSIRLLGSSQNALREPYKRAMGANAPFDPLTPEAKAVLLKRGFDPENPTAAVQPPATLAPNRTQRVVQNGVTYDVTTDATGKVVSSKAVQP